MTGKQQSWESTLWPWIPIFALLSKLPRQSHEQKTRICVSRREKCGIMTPTFICSPEKENSVCLTHARHFICSTWNQKEKKQRFWSVTIPRLSRRGSRGYRWLCVEAEIHPDVTQHLNFQAQINASSSPTSQVHREEKGAGQLLCGQVHQVQCQALILLTTPFKYHIHTFNMCNPTIFSKFSSWRSCHHHPILEHALPWKSLRPICNHCSPPFVPGNH